MAEGLADGGRANHRQEKLGSVYFPIEAACPFRYTEVLTTKEKAVQAVALSPTPPPASKKFLTPSRSLRVFLWRPPNVSSL
jgi:hypothetical protein